MFVSFRFVSQVLDALDLNPMELGEVGVDFLRSCIRYNPYTGFVYLPKGMLHWAPKISNVASELLSSVIVAKENMSEFLSSDIPELDWVSYKVRLGPCNRSLNTAMEYEY